MQHDVYTLSQFNGELGFAPVGGITPGLQQYCFQLPDAIFKLTDNFVVMLMVRNVACVAHTHQILWSVVKRIVVYMMNPAVLF
jgi:hypothetical protein